MLGAPRVCAGKPVCCLPPTSKYYHSYCHWLYYSTASLLVLLLALLLKLLTRLLASLTPKHRLYKQLAGYQQVHNLAHLHPLHRECGGTWHQAPAVGVGAAVGFAVALLEVRDAIRTVIGIGWQRQRRLPVQAHPTRKTGTGRVLRIFMRNPTFFSVFC